MITVKEIKPNIFELIETIGWFGDIVCEWYWDLDKKLISESADFPKNCLTRYLNDDDLLRFEERYKPLILRKEPINYENINLSSTSHV